MCHSHRPPLLHASLIAFILTSILFTCTSRPEAIHHGVFAPSRLDSVIGQDGVCSIKFSDDITLWTFADTITGSWRDEEHKNAADKSGAVIDGMISNSLAWSGKITDQNFRNIYLHFYKENNHVVQFIKNRSDEDPMHHRFWALDGFRSGNRLYVFYLHVYIPSSAKFLEFSILYTGVARWDIPPDWKPGDRVSFKRLGRMFGKDAPCFGAAVLEKDGYLYLAGHIKKSANEFPVSIARVKTEDTEKIDSYSFLTADGKWSGSIDSAGRFFNDVSGECSLSYNEQMKRYVIIYSRIYSGDIASVTFSDFSQIMKARNVTVADLPDPKSGQMWSYSAKEIFSSAERIYLIYINPETYQPMLVELRY